MFTKRSSSQRENMINGDGKKMEHGIERKNSGNVFSAKNANLKQHG